MIIQQKILRVVALLVIVVIIISDIILILRGVPIAGILMTNNPLVRIVFLFFAFIASLAGIIRNSKDQG